MKISGECYHELVIALSSCIIEDIYIYKKASDEDIKKFCSSIKEIGKLINKDLEFDIYAIVDEITKK